MKETSLVARVRDRPDALERVSGLLRRRAFAIRRLSLASVGDGFLELVIRIDTATTDPERVRHELLTLRDVDRITPDDSSLPRATKELLLARLRADGGTPTPGGDGVFEMVGSPEQIDAVLARLHAEDSISGFVRSGEIALP